MRSRPDPSRQRRTLATGADAKSSRFERHLAQDSASDSRGVLGVDSRRSTLTPRAFSDSRDYPANRESSEGAYPSTPSERFGLLPIERSCYHRRLSHGWSASQSRFTARYALVNLKKASSRSGLPRAADRHVPRPVHVPLAAARRGRSGGPPLESAWAPGRSAARRGAVPRARRGQRDVLADPSS
jgi:hypothetical protein